MATTMQYVSGVFLFCVVLFLYLHIQFHLKTGEDLEMYEMDMPSKDKLEDICDIRQPVLFTFDSQHIEQLGNLQHLQSNYGAFEVKLRNVLRPDPLTEMYIPLQLQQAVTLFQEDKQAQYLSENNQDFLEETGAIKVMRYNDDFLRPYMVSNCFYDLLLGSPQVRTPLRYEINYRNFYVLTQGAARVKLIPPHAAKYLYPEYDYENFEFRSPVDPWKPQVKYAADFSKVKSLEVPLAIGKTLFVPAFWWYSIEFDAPNTSICCFHYRTYMNNLAISPYVARHALQIQNVRREVAKKVQVSELSAAPAGQKPAAPIPAANNDNQNPNDLLPPAL